MILDPMFKTEFWSDHANFIVGQYNITVKKLMETFKLVVQDFAEKEKEAKKSSSNKYQPQVVAPVEDFDNVLY
jgi:hypothetical protein